MMKRREIFGGSPIEIYERVDSLASFQVVADCCFVNQASVQHSLQGDLKRVGRNMLTR